ncbi:MAG TPA: hypothetical protein IAA05_01925, partial [Candidatus Blautia excrementipullorum]|nr:hypothetical protein [Candidatus Blautia excrementipullorum]
QQKTRNSDNTIIHIWFLSKKIFPHRHRKFYALFLGAPRLSYYSSKLDYKTPGGSLSRENAARLKGKTRSL